MKKILFFLLISIVGLAQTPTGQEQEFDYGIKNNAAPTVAVPNYLTTQGATGVYGKIEPINLPISTTTQNALDMKLNISDLPTNLTLYPTTVASDVAGYVKMVTDIHDVDYNEPAVDVSTPAITGTAQLISQRISAPGILIGQPGVFNITSFGNIRRLSGLGTATFYFQIYHRDLAGIETLICTSSTSAPVTENIYVEFSASGVWDDGEFSATDRIVVKTYANRIAGGSDPVYQFQFGGATPVRLILPVPFSVVDAGYELKENKASTLTPSDILYPNNNAVLDALPKEYAVIVYMNSDYPSTATIFDDVNPPITNDEALKEDSDNLYIGYDASTWIWNSVINSYVSKILPRSSNFYISGTPKDAGSTKVSPISRPGTIQTSGFIKTGGTSSQFLKADGSVDTSIYENTSNKSDSYTLSSSTTYASTKALVDGLDTKVGGVGTANYIPKFTGGSTLGNSSVFNEGDEVGIGTAFPISTLDVFGSVTVGNGSDGNGIQLRMLDGSSIRTIDPTDVGRINSINFGCVGSGGDLRAHGNSHFWLSQSGTTTYASLLDTGNLLINTTADNGIDKLQVNGTISATNYTGSATLTGTPSAPTAPLGTNTTQIATTAFVAASVTASTLGNVLTTGNQTIYGKKTFINNGISQSIYSLNTGAGIAIYSENSDSGIGVSVNNLGSGTAMHISNNSSVGTAINVANAYGGGGIVSNGYFTTTGDLFTGKNEGLKTFSVNKLGDVVANSFIKSGGTSSQYLMADGSVTDSFFQRIDEGSGFGTIFGNQSRIFYGNIGLDAYDFSFSGTVSSVFGATGESSFAAGIDNISSGYGSTTFGYLNNNASIEGFSGGVNSQSVGYVNTTLGVGHNVTGTNITVVGQAANIITESTASNNIGTSPVFVVGNGTITDGSDYVVATRSDALIVRKNGVVEAPSQTIAEIDSGITKTIPTKEWVQAQRPYKVYTAIIDQSGTNPPQTMVLQNTLSGSVVWTRGGVGYYYATLSGAFTNSKTYSTAQASGLDADIVKIARISDNQLMLTVADLSGAGRDGVLAGSSVEIRVYN